MIPLKYIVEMEVPEEAMLAINSNPAGLKIDDLVQTRMENAFPKWALIAYRAEEGKKKIDQHKVCPACQHSWALHFSTVKMESGVLSDGTPATRGVLAEPSPVPCPECAAAGKSCNEASK